MDKSIDAISRREQVASVLRWTGILILGLPSFLLIGAEESGSSLISDIVVSFGPAEYVGLLTLSLVAAIAYGADRVTHTLVKSMACALFGLLLGSVGLEPISDVFRFLDWGPFGEVSPTRHDAFPFVAVGMLALAQVAVLLSRSDAASRAGWFLKRLASRQVLQMGLLMLAMNQFLADPVVQSLIFLTVAAVVGYSFVWLALPRLPFVIGLLFSSLFEEHLRRALLLARGDGLIFLTRPISAGLLMVSVAMLVLYVFVRRQPAAHGDP